MPQKKIMPVNWPHAGLVEATAWANQPDNSTTDCLNVRNFDQLDKRIRGGQRAGIVKYVDSQINGTNNHQAIGDLSTEPSTEETTEVVDEDSNGNTDTFTSATSNKPIQDHNPKWSNYEGTVNAVSFFVNPATGTDGMGVFAGVGAAAQAEGMTNRSGAVYEAIDLGDSYNLEIGFRAGTGGFAGVVGIAFRLTDDPTRNRFYLFRLSNASLAELIRVTGPNSNNVVATRTFSALATNTNHTMAVDVKGDTVRLFINGVQQGDPVSLKSYSGQTRFGIVSRRVSAMPDSVHIRYFKATKEGDTIIRHRSTKLIVVSGGSISVGTPSGGFSIPTGGNAALRTSGRIGMTEAFRDMFFCDGLAANYKYYDSSANQVKSWASDITGGSLPAGSVDTTQGCSIIATYRGRIVMAGLKEEPHNWFMSKAGDPFDWDYSPPSPSPLQAVAGNNSNVGEVGDLISAIAPFQDDVMFMAGMTSLWIMRGDPMLGGSIDNISRKVGIVGPDAWTTDAEGNMYFMAQTGLYRIAYGGTMPEPLSRGKLPKTLADIDTTVNNVVLQYHPRQQGVYIFLCPPNQPGTVRTHYFWDERTDSFFPDRYPGTFGPACAHLFSSDNPDEAALILGSYDGYLRTFRDSAVDDDGELIESYVRIPLLPTGNALLSHRLDELVFVLDQQSSPVTLRVWSGDTLEEAERLADAGAAPAFVRTLRPGRNSAIRHRRADNVFLIELRREGEDSAATWAYESGTAVLTPVSRMRGRHVS